MKAIEKVSKEIQTAKEKYGAFNSTHELYGVLAEELDEFWDEVKMPNADKDLFRNDPDYISEDLATKKANMINELTQIAAIALRGIDELQHNEIKWV